MGVNFYTITNKGGKNSPHKINKIFQVQNYWKLKGKDFKDNLHNRNGLRFDFVIKILFVTPNKRELEIYTRNFIPWGGEFLSKLDQTDASVRVWTSS